MKLKSQENCEASESVVMVYAISERSLVKDSRFPSLIRLVLNFSKPFGNLTGG